MKKKIIIHDHGNHDFIHQLSEWLSNQNIELYHIIPSNSETPNKNTQYNSTKNKFIIKILYKNNNKYNLLFRIVDEIKYFLQIKNYINDINPDYYVSTCNSPIVNFLILSIIKKNKRTKFINWIQDIYYLALLNSKSSIKKILYLIVKFIENKTIKLSDKIIVNSSDFQNHLKIDDKKKLIMHNWANKYRINKSHSRKNVNNALNILYTGTIGLKHDPLIFCKLAERLQEHNVYITIHSEGIGADKINDYILKLKLKNIKVKNYVEIEKFNDVLSSADLFLVVLEKAASKFSTPSKILNYICIGKPIIGIIENDNLSAKLINENRLGKIFNSDELDKLINYIINNKQIKYKLIEKNCNEFKEKFFNINKIGLSFLNFINND